MQAASRRNLEKARRARRASTTTAKENQRLITARNEYRTNTASAKKVPLGRQAHLQVQIGKAAKAGNTKSVKRLQAQQRAGQRDTSYGGYAAYVKHLEKVAKVAAKRRKIRRKT